MGVRTIQFGVSFEGTEADRHFDIKTPCCLGEGDVMKIFDSLWDRYFKKDEEGRNVFFPFGILGSGYVVDNVLEQRSRLFMNCSFAVGMTGLIWLVIQILTAELSMQTTLAYLLIILTYLGVIPLGLKILIRGAPKSDLKLSYEEAVKGTSAENQSMDGFSYWASITGMSLAGIGSLYWGVSSGNTTLIYSGIFFSVVSILGLIGRALIKKNS